MTWDPQLAIIKLIDTRIGWPKGECQFVCGTNPRYPGTLGLSWRSAPGDRIWTLPFEDAYKMSLNELLEQAESAIAIALIKGDPHA